MKLAAKVEKIARETNNAELLDLVAAIEDAEDDAAFLGALRAAGVDNWEGYEHAQEFMG